MSNSAQVRIQISRVLEDVRTLRRTYAPSQEDAPELARALRDAERALEQAIADLPGPTAGGS